MATTEKRPRIRPETAAQIDLVRKRVPFEVFVNDAIGTYLDLFWMWRLRKDWRPGSGDVENKWTARMAKDNEILRALLSDDSFGFDGERFEKAAQDTLAYWRARMDEFAEEDAREAAED